MTRLSASPDPRHWIAITGGGLRAGGRRRAAIRMLMGSSGIGRDVPGSGLIRFIANRTTAALLKRADGSVHVWSLREDGELLVAIAQVQELTSRLRAARAMMPMEYDDTEPFASPFLGDGERLVMDSPTGPQGLLTVTYTWDTGTHLVTVQGMSGDRERFRTLLPLMDELARSVRIDGDFSVDEGRNVLRLPPA